jgi:hypothetical protein
MDQKILVKLPNIKFHENPLSRSRLFSFVRADGPNGAVLVGAPQCCKLAQRSKNFELFTLQQWIFMIPTVKICAIIPMNVFLYLKKYLYSLCEVVVKDWPILIKIVLFR